MRGATLAPIYTVGYDIFFRFEFIWLHFYNAHDTYYLPSDLFRKAIQNASDNNVLNFNHRCNALKDTQGLLSHFSEIGKNFSCD